MKEKDNIDILFERLKDNFDFESPEDNHQQRFLEKLNHNTKLAKVQSKGVVSLGKKKRNWLNPLSVAASIVLVSLLGLQFFKNQPSIKEQVVEIAPEVSRTEFYFANLIENQVQQLKEEKSPETKQLVDDTLSQLNRLETDYQMLEQDLLNGGNSKIILNAMIINFQTRIDLLKEVLNNIEEIKNLKSYNDANYTI
jgi:DNA-directed RNA polymerase beta' subunit